MCVVLHHVKAAHVLVVYLPASGIICCNACSKARRGLRNIHVKKPVRVCDKCVSGQSEGMVARRGSPTQQQSRLVRHSHLTCAAYPTGRRTMFHVRVGIQSGHQLPAVDSSGTSSPYVFLLAGCQLYPSGLMSVFLFCFFFACRSYVKVFVGEQLYGQTPVKRKDVHPRWSNCSYKCLVRNLRTTEVRLEVRGHATACRYRVPCAWHLRVADHSLLVFVALLHAVCSFLSCFPFCLFSFFRVCFEPGLGLGVGWRAHLPWAGRLRPWRATGHADPSLCTRGAVGGSPAWFQQRWGCARACVVRYDQG